ncbi:hypothetical protein X956_03475 [Trueperella pyogenes TP8]|nr:hypothetical protein X956_03475 [Trueperella pyogenes TP8]
MVYPVLTGIFVANAPQLNPDERILNRLSISDLLQFTVEA